MVRPEKKVEAPVRVLRPGESSLVDRYLTDLEIILFRPLQPDATGTRHVASRAPDGEARTAPGCNSSASHDSASRRATCTHEHSAAIANQESGFPRSSGFLPATMTDVPLPSRPPLFFDTAACVFYDGINKTDYVATGRLTTDIRGVQYVPHAVVVGNEVAPNGYSTYNIDEEGSMDGARMLSDSNLTGVGAGAGGGVGGSAGEYPDETRYRNAPEMVATSGGTVTAAGDGIEVNLRKLGLCSGLLVNASLFTKDASLDEAKNVYYMVRKPKTTMPLWLVPLTVPDSRYHSSISVMLRRVKINGESVWELSNVSEPLIPKDVKTVVTLMERRGLHDPPNYLPDFDKRAADNTDDHAQNSSYSGSDFSGDNDNSESSRDANKADGEDASDGKPNRPAGAAGGDGALLPTVRRPPTQLKDFADLLANVPVVTREGRRQYNIGRAHIRGGVSRGGASGGEVSTDEDDEILDDALRAVMPRYANGHLVRYDDGTYNVGSRPATLALHYVDHREVYGLERAIASTTSAGGWPGSSGGGAGLGPVGNSFCADGSTPAAGTLPPLAYRSSWALSSFAPTGDVPGWAGGAALPLDRFAEESTDGERPPLPPEFTQEPVLRKEVKRSGWGSHPRRGTAAQQRRASAIGRKRSSGGKDGRGRGSAKGGRKKKAGTLRARSKAAPSEREGGRPRSRTTSPARQRDKAAPKKPGAKRTASAKSKKSSAKTGRLGDGIAAA